MENEGTESLAYKRISGTHKGCPIRRERGERERERVRLSIVPSGHSTHRPNGLCHGPRWCWLRGPSPGQFEKRTSIICAKDEFHASCDTACKLSVFRVTGKLPRLPVL